MKGKKPSSMIQASERVLTIVGALVCVILAAALWQWTSNRQPIWPRPGVYFLEMTGWCASAAYSIVRDLPWARTLTWATVGVLSAFVVMGLWSIGLLFAPIAAIFALAATLSGRRHRESIFSHLAAYVMAGIAQVALMLLLFRLP